MLAMLSQDTFIFQGFGQEKVTCGKLLMSSQERIHSNTLKIISCLPGDFILRFVVFIYKGLTVF